MSRGSLSAVLRRFMSIYFLLQTVAFLKAHHRIEKATCETVLEQLIVLSLLLGFLGASPFPSKGKK